MDSSAALLVIDVQAGAFDGKAIPAIYAGQTILDRISGLISAARTASVPVIFIQHCAPEGQLLTEGTPAWKLHAAIRPEPVDAVVFKRESSAFEGTDLQSLLDQQGIDTLITCGLQSEHCVTNTTIAALELGLTVYVAEDAHSTWPTDEIDAASIIRRQNEYLTDKGANVQPGATLEVLLSA